MSQPFVGEVKFTSWGFAPRGWALCNGQILQISQNQALYSILGTTYGGNGQTTFALPNLVGRTPINWGTGPGLAPVTIGQVGGEPVHTLVLNEMPSHNHIPGGSSATAGSNSAAGSLLGTPATATYRQSSSNLSALVPGTVGNNVGGQPHNNMQPYLVINFIIALQGIYPSRN